MIEKTVNAVLSDSVITVSILVKDDSKLSEIEIQTEQISENSTEGNIETTMEVLEPNIEQ